MLNEKERNMIRRYCLLPKLSLAAVLCAFGACAIWLLLVMIDDIALNSKSFYHLGLYVFLAIVIVYLIVFGYASVAPRLGMRRRPWKELGERLRVQQSDKDYTGQLAASLGASAAGRMIRDYGSEALEGLGTGLEVAGAIGAAGTVAEISMESLTNAKAMAAAYQVPVPRARKWILLLVLIPLLLLTAVFIPEFMDSASAIRQEKMIASRSVYSLQELFHGECAYVSIDDPNERYQDDYRVCGYLTDFEDPQMAYVAVKVDGNGHITEAVYNMKIDVSRSKEENLTLAAENLKKLNTMLRRTKVKAVPTAVLDVYTLPAELTEKLTQGTYYEEINVPTAEKDGAAVYWSYMTDTEEEYDEYSSSEIYLRIAGTAR